LRADWLKNNPSGTFSVLPFLRAFKTETGELLWKGRLPAGGRATPMTYRLRPDGKQFVVIAAGGHKYLRTKMGGSVVAYVLPDG
jgi:quinoprotein glucose dehydrogenase